MSKLSIYLPPFSPDYSGVCSALFELGGLIVIHDASGCTGNYTGYDEPRWYNSKQFIYCSRLREIDAVMGDDDKLIDKIKKAANDLKPNFIAVLGSPVPMLIGTDFKGLAYELESETGIKTFGFDSTGLNYYDTGLSNAFFEIAKHYIDESYKAELNKVNILGLNPLDFSINGNDLDIVNYLKFHNYDLNVSLSMNAQFEDIKKILKAELNIVVSKSGLQLARYLERKYNMPYVVGIPNDYSDRFLNRLKNKEKYPIITHAKSETLLIHDQVIASSLREAFIDSDKIDVGVIVGLDSELSSENDINLKNEKEIKRIVNSGKYKRIIADPLILDLISNEDVEKIELPYVAISSRLHWDDYVKFISFRVRGK